MKDSLKYYFPKLSAISKKNRNAFTILILGFMITAIATFQIYLSAEEKAEAEFETICDEINVKMDTRLHAHALILRAGSAFFAATDTVTQSEWNRFIESSEIELNLPGILGTGFSAIIPKDELHQHIQNIQKEGFPDYTIYPAGDREIYTSIIYLEPFSGRNLRAFGYDMFSEPVRRKAMELSRDNNLAALSGKVLLVQETNKDVQMGTLMYVPVYRKGMTINTIEQRRAAILGWVYSPYRMNDLMLGILGKRNEISDNKIRLLIYDDTISDSSLLYDSQSNDAHSYNSPSRTFSIPVEFNGKKWVLVFSQLNNKLFSLNWIVIILFFAGIFISFLLYHLYLSLTNKEARAIQIAEGLTFELKDKSWKLEKIIEGTNVGTWEWNVQTGETIFNEQWAEMLGYSLEELSPVTIKIWKIHTHPGDLRKSEKLLKRHFAGELPYYDCELRMKHKNGQWIWIHDRGRVITKTSEGEPLMMFGMHSIITKRKEAEERIKIQNEELQKLNFEKDKFFSIIAHDLKSPFNSIMGFSDLLIEQVSDHDYDGIARYATIIQLSSKRAMDLLINLMEWSQSQTGRMEFNPEYFELVDLIKETTVLLSGAMEQKSISISKNVPANLPVFGDKKMISTILRNLISNALKFTHPEGKISISVEEKQEELLVSVSDNGVGIPKANINKLFKIDESYSTAGTKNEKGTGLGLILCKEFVKKHGGKIWIESEEGKGSTFYFTIPTNNGN